MLYKKKPAQIRAMMQVWAEDIEAGRLDGFGLSMLLRDNKYLRGPDGPRLRRLYDNDPGLWGRTGYDGLAIRPPDEIQKGRGRIIVFVGAYCQVKEQLEGLGLREYEDFMNSRDFFLLYYWHKYRRVFLEFISVFVTSKCTLRCRDCSLMMPKQADPGSLSLEAMIADMEALLSLVDRIQILSIIGGEPLINKNLPEFLDYLSRESRGRVFSIHFVSNGTIVPDGKLIRAVKKFGDVFFTLSDYSPAVEGGYAEKFRRTVQELERHQINFKTYQPIWGQFYSDDPDEILFEAGPDLIRHYDACRSRAGICPGYQNGRLYPCQSSWAAEQLGWVACAPDDYLDLKKLDPNDEDDRFKVLAAYLGHTGAGHLALCRQCRGNDQAPASPVLGGLQAEAEPGPR